MCLKIAYESIRLGHNGLKDSYTYKNLSNFWIIPLKSKKSLRPEDTIGRVGFLLSAVWIPKKEEDID